MKNLDYIKSFTVKDLLDYYDITIDAVTEVKGIDSEEYADAVAYKKEFMSCLEKVDIVIEELNQVGMSFFGVYKKHGDN